MIDGETRANRDDERHDQRLEIPKAFVLKIQHHEDVEAAMTQPQTSGMPKSSCSAIAEPTTSARSHAAIAIRKEPRANETGLE